MDMILVVCGAGASSTFLASRMRALATERGLDITARAGVVQIVPSSTAADVTKRKSASKIIGDGAHSVTTTVTVVVTPTIAATPSSAQPGASITVTGSGYPGVTAINIAIDGITFCSTASNSAGTYSKACLVPTTLPGGIAGVEVNPPGIILPAVTVNATEAALWPTVTWTPIAAAGRCAGTTSVRRCAR